MTQSAQSGNLFWDRYRRTRVKAGYDIPWYRLGRGVARLSAVHKKISCVTGSTTTSGPMGVPQALSTSHSRSGLQNLEIKQNFKTTFKMYVFYI